MDTVNLTITSTTLDEIFPVLAKGYCVVEENEPSNIGEFQMRNAVSEMFQEVMEKVAEAGYDPVAIFEKYMIENEMEYEDNPYENLRKDVDSTFSISLNVTSIVWDFCMFQYRWEQAKRDLNKKFGGRIKEVLPLETDLFFVLPYRTLFTDGVIGQDTSASPVDLELATYVILADHYDLTTVESRSNTSFTVYLKESEFQSSLFYAESKLKKLMDQIWNHPNIVIQKGNINELLKTLDDGFNYAIEHDIFKSMDIAEEIDSIMIALKVAGYNHDFLSEVLRYYDFRFSDEFENLPMRKNIIDLQLHLAIHLNNEELDYCYRVSKQLSLTKGDEQ